VHEHSFFSIILELSLDRHCAWLRSRVDLGLDVFARLVTPSFKMASNIFPFNIMHQIGPRLFCNLWAHVDNL